MAYVQNRDPYPDQGDANLLTSPTGCYLLTAGMIGAQELPIYSKQLSIYVPDGVTAGITMVYLGDDDSAPVTRKFGPGNHTVAARVRRITAVTGTGVEIHVETR